MADEKLRLNIIQRYAERMRAEGGEFGSLLSAPLQNGPEARHAGIDGEAAPPAPFRSAMREGVEKLWPVPVSAAIESPTAQIDLRRLERMGWIIPGATAKTPLSEQFQSIKRPLLQKLQAADGVVNNRNVIMVTSAMGGEGKTFVAINLAMSIASEMDLFVMIIDGNIHGQSLLSPLGLTAKRGLTDLLLDSDLDISEVMLRTNVPKLTILPAGPAHPRETELLSSQRMSKVMAEIVSRYPDRIVIIDSPPVLGGSEAGVLASHVEQIVMVVAHNQTGWRPVERSLTRLQDNAQVNFVLNKVA